MLAHAPNCIRTGCINHSKQGRIGLLIFRCGARQGTYDGLVAFSLHQLIVQSRFANVGWTDDNYPVLVAKGLTDLGSG